MQEADRKGADRVYEEPTPFPTSCYLCGGRDLALRFPERRTPESESGFYSCTSFGHGQHPPIWRCRGCNLLFQWPMPDPDDLLKAYGDVEDPLYVGERDNRYHTFRRGLSQVRPPQSPPPPGVRAYRRHLRGV